MIIDLATLYPTAAAVEQRLLRSNAPVAKPKAGQAGAGVDTSLLKEKISAALALRDGWNGPRSLAPSAEIAYRVEYLVTSALQGLESPHLPFIVPMSCGGLQVEWHRNGADLEVAFLGSGEISGLFEDRVAGGEIESEGTEAIDLLLRNARRVAQKTDNARDVPRPAPHQPVTVAA